MRPDTCKNCSASEFLEEDDAYVCAYCNSRFPKTPPAVTKEIHYVQVPIPVRQEPPASQPVKQELPAGRKKNKWLAFFLCLYLGMFGAHKFYEGRPGQGVLYLLTVGLFGFGWLADIFILLFKPNPYYVA